jgi:large conductance mechanosensitive channel
MPKDTKKTDTPPKKDDEQKAGYVSGFMDFIREQGVVGFAIGFILGAASTTLVKSLVDNIVMPPINILLGSADGLKNLKLYLGSSDGKVTYLQYGQFLNDLINFIILALLRLDRLDKKKA